MTSPRAHIVLIKNRCANVMEFAEVRSAIAWLRNDLVEFAIFKNAACCTVGKIKIVGKIQDAAIGSGVENAIVIGIGVE